MAVNCTSVQLATQIQVIFTIIKVLALIIIILGGIVKLCQGKSTYHCHLNHRNMYHSTISRPTSTLNTITTTENFLQSSCDYYSVVVYVLGAELNVGRRGRMVHVSVI